jgi:Zn-dependent peptidase ImmA (M78 family)
LSEILRIAGLCDQLIARYGTRNPFSLADAMGVRVVSCPDFQNLEGMYKVILGERFVFLKGSLSRRRAGQILAHELGHDALHREMGEDSIVQDTFLVDMALKPEYEANLFAAQILLPDEETLSLLKEGKTVREIASFFKVEEALVELKIQILDQDKEKT